MIILDIYPKLKKQVGVLFSLFPVADLHLLLESKDNQKDPEHKPYSPLDPEAWWYIKECFDEVRNCETGIFGEKTYSVTVGDIGEIERSSVRKIKRQMKKNDCRAEDTIYKYIIDEHILPKLRRLLKGTEYLGGSSGNHLIEWFNKKVLGENSEEYIVKKLGGEYLGEAHAVLNFHINSGGTRSLIKVLVTHGSKGGSKASIVRELEQIHKMYGKIDCVIKAHAHEPLDTFYCRYELPKRADLPIQKHECLVVCLGSTRAGIKKGYDDYTEQFNYQPTAGRFPVILFHASRTSRKNRNVEIKLRPYTM